MSLSCKGILVKNSRLVIKFVSNFPADLNNASVVSFFTWKCFTLVKEKVVWVTIEGKTLKMT